MAISLKELRRRGYSDDAIALAKQTQESQKRVGAPVHTLHTILTGREQGKARAPEDLTPRQLRKKGRVGGAAVLLDQEALTVTDAVRQAELRRMSARLKEIAETPQQLEFNFFKGNWSVSNEYWDTIRERIIKGTSETTSRKNSAIAVLAEVIRHVGWETSKCEVNAAEIARLLKMQPADVSRALALLEKVGAIYRVHGGSRNEKAIHLNPEGVYRGNVTVHTEAVDKFAKVVAFPRQM